MTTKQKSIVMLLIIATLLIFFSVVGLCIIKMIKNKRSPEKYNKAGVSMALIFTGCVLLSIWILKYNIFYVKSIASDIKINALTILGGIVSGLMDSLRTFALEEDYMGFINDVKQMYETAFAADAFGASVFKTVLTCFASVLHIAAPTVGGAIILELFVSIFPKIRLRFSYWALWREKYYFSELNDSSLALAKSIFNEKASLGRKPVIIFTDTYVDDNDEKSYERFLEAKLLGAICLKDDLAHVKKNMFGKRKYFLVDEKGAENLQTLTNLSNLYNMPYIKRSEIYFFANDDAYVQVEKSIRKKLKETLSEDELPIFIPVHHYSNLVSNLLVDIPLYEPIIGKKKEKNKPQMLTVTILGTGYIGREMFLTTYWMGQMLDCKLKINVLSQETESEFWSNIDYINPEIKQSTIEDHEILRIYSGRDEFAARYCEVKYIPCDVKSTKFIDCMMGDKNNILETDYFLVALGNDEDNISVANTVRRYVGQHHVKDDQTGRAVIAYVVYDSALAAVLNTNTHFSHIKRGVDIYMKAIGCLHEVYSVKNVFMNEYDPWERIEGSTSNSRSDRKRRAEIHKKRIMENNYNHWSSMAQKMHAKYKAYSMGLVNVSIFDCNGSLEQYRQAVTESLERYSEMLSGKERLSEDTIKLLHRMAWLEHRRWNAYMRAQGFRHTSEYRIYGDPKIKGSYKQMDLKLHPCIMECDENGTRLPMNEYGVIDGSARIDGDAPEGCDLLDELTYDLNKHGYYEGDFKINDYPKPFDK